MMIFTWMNLFPALLMIFCGFTSFISSRKHLLNILLSLEFIMLGIFLMFMVMLSSFSETFLSLFFLTLVACEGALGLSMLILIVRTHGNDCFNSFSILQC
uniref:NADH-ubiquinone oxidoreductase chain 4L n=1 Tax=Strahlaxius plectrorhynchus TaxID=2302681 RepID=A0A4Y5QJI6_9EUCA|nr:NADH dehydrogenase subunit 4L [Strahlaxius plectrorhynchus]QCX31787.1 NADH dehydrogenase subunit 4L [Strahlaxius plectrorhynchus]